MVHFFEDGAKMKIPSEISQPFFKCIAYFLKTKLSPTFSTICANLYQFGAWRVISCISFYLFEALGAVVSKLGEIGFVVV